MAPKFRRNKEKKINEILDAVVKLTSEKGPNNFSINDIPEIANVSIGTVYRYFPRGKNDILHQILLRNIERQQEILQGNQDALDLDSFWKPIIQNMMEVSNKFDAISEMMVEAAPPDSEFYKELSLSLMKHYQEMAEKLSTFPDIVDISTDVLALRIGLCFRLFKKIIQAQETVHLFEEDKIVEYMLGIVRATFARAATPSNL